MNEPAYVTVKIFCWILGTIVMLFLAAMGGTTQSLSARVTENSEDVKENNKLIYEYQLQIVRSLGEIKMSIAQLEN